MRKATLLACLLLVAGGCTSKRDRARTAADLWHMGKALTVTQGKMPPGDLILMGEKLQQIADRWSQDLKVPFDKSPTRRTK